MSRLWVLSNTISRFADWWQAIRQELVYFRTDGVYINPKLLRKNKSKQRIYFNFFLNKYTLNAYFSIPICVLVVLFRISLLFLSEPECIGWLFVCLQCWKLVFPSLMYSYKYAHSLLNLPMISKEQLQSLLQNLEWSLVKLEHLYSNMKYISTVI